MILFQLKVLGVGTYLVRERVLNCTYNKMSK